MPSECFMSSCKASPFFTSLCSPAFPCLQVLYSFVIVMVKENMNWLVYKKSALEYIKLKVPLVSAHSNSSFTLGFAFVYFVDERDARDAIRYLDNTLFGHSRRRLSVEWAKGGRGSRLREGSRVMANHRPTKTLFVINFDPTDTRIRDIERHFEPFGKVLHVRIRRNFAFVQFETQEQATKALECTHMSKILDRVVSVEYALRDDGERDDRHGSPRRGYSPRGHSRSPVLRTSRPSPDYGRSRSPVLRRGLPSPDYGRARSPVYDRYSGAYYRDRSPDYGRYPRRGLSRSRSRSPVRR